MKLRNSALLVFAFAVVSTTLAQGKNPQPTAIPFASEANWPVLKQQLGLKASQIKDLKALAATVRQRLQPPKSGPRPSMFTAMIGFDGKIRQILTRAQYSKLEKIGGGGRFLGRPDPMDRFSALKLTVQQRSQLLAVFVGSRRKMEALRNTKGLTDEQRTQRMMHIREDSRKLLESILTPEQLEMVPQPGMPRRNS
jgi:hypothetical protein